MASFHPYRHVFTPLKVGRTTLKNRVEFSPLVCDMVASNGEVTQGYIDFVERQAESGAAIIHLGATPVNWDNAPDAPHELDVTDDAKCGGLELLAEAAHRHGAKLSVELLHAGRGADPALIRTPEVIAPSNISIPDRHPYIREMDQRDMEKVIADFVDCARRLQRCRFDGVLIHGAHGNLIAQFLSPLFNHRTDMYGGSFENRCRFPLMLLRAVREAVGPDFLVELRISGDEILPEGMHTDEVVEFLKLAQEHIDLVTVSAGLIVDSRIRFYCMPPYYHPKGFNVKFARQIRQCPDIRIPVSVVGGIISAEMADQIIDEGSADMVAMARALLADPDMLNKSYRGKAEDARPCLRCWDCCGNGYNHIHCAVNPALCRDARYAEVRPARTAKKVVVVGGGVAGTQAARTLVQRGHQVVLMEKSDRLGGMLPFIDKLPFKDDMLRYEQWLVRSTMACGADIRLNCEATAENVMAERPDAIVVAVGSSAIRPGIPGIDVPHVASVLDVDSGAVSVSGRVVVCGGGLSGCESALALAMEGCDVTVVDMLPVERFASGCSEITRTMLMHLLEQHGVRLIGEHLVREITADGVKAEGKDWSYLQLPADHVVDAFGRKPNATMAQRFFELIPDVYYVGDCGQVRNIMYANLTAYDTCCNI